MRSELTNPFKWVSIFRVTAITVILGIGIYFLSKYPSPFSVIPLWIIVGITYITTFIYWLCIRRGKFSNLILGISSIIDVFIISTVVHYTGGIESEFVFLYYFPIVEASMFFYLKGGASIATLCLSTYATVLGLEFYKIIVSTSVVSNPDMWGLYTKLYLQATFFYLIAVTSGYLAERVKQKVEALEQVKLDTSTILQSIKSGLLVIDYNGVVLYKNNLAEKILGTTISENLKDLIPNLYDEGFKEITVYSKIIGIHTFKLRDTKEEDRGVVLVLDDLTESIITERLATIGKFSGDLAHEVRNPLATIQGSCELIREGVDKLESKKLLDNILSHTRRLNNIVTNFLSYAKPIPLKQENIEIGKLLNETIKLAPNKLPIEIIQPKPLWVKLDQEQIKTAFLNLILNAFESMDSNGKLQIKVTPPLQKYYVFEENRNTGEDEMVICFKDIGKGILDAEITQIFTPFYTTKKGGAGLGLSIVSKIIETHKGRIEVKSKVGEGTIFVIHFPYKF
ncbi:MAG: hypothetical protein HY769_05530 [Candidatus Stahlbacteria bacterium]|nr:hypothetical protein [Candidatus Stahlbacteria bacterium]